jgi:uncharacterized protein YjbI with pentapeptide repeats
MRWLKRDMWKISIPLAGLLLLLLLMVLIPLSASAHEGTPRVALAGTVQATPTIDLTVTALSKEQLALQVKQLQNQLQDQNNWFANNSTALIAAITAIIVAFIGFTQWSGNRRDERRKEIVAQDKELRAQGEERFKAAVTALGSDNEATQVGGAILLRSFLNKGDEAIYGRYYSQIFDLAAAYLRLSNTSRLPEDPDGLPQPPVDPNAPLPMTPLRQALIVVFKEAFPLARSRLGLVKASLEAHSLDASGVRLDGAYLARVDLEYVWMRDASFIGANLHETKLHGSDLIGAHFNKADLVGADLSKANLREANLGGAILTRVNLSEADLYGADLEGTVLIRTDLRGVNGKTKAWLEACRAKGAIINEDTTTDSSQPDIAPAQVLTPPPSTDGSSSTVAQPKAEP